jgi:hypothetical protein
MDITLPRDVIDALSEAVRLKGETTEELALRILREQSVECPSTDEEYKRQLAQVDLPKSRYDADMHLHDRSLDFSSEILRIALAGIAVVGFIFSRIPEHLQGRVFSNPAVLILIFLSLISFLVSAGFALLYRYQAGGAVFHHIDYLKIVALNCNNSFVEAKSRAAESKRDRKFFKLNFYTRFAAIMLIFAAGFLGAAFILFSL